MSEENNWVFFKFFDHIRCIFVGRKCYATNCNGNYDPEERKHIKDTEKKRNISDTANTIVYKRHWSERLEILNY